MNELAREIITQLSDIGQSLRPSLWVILTATGTLAATIIALLSSFDIFRKIYKPKQKIYTGDRIEFVISSDKKIHKIHLNLTVSNLRFYPISVKKVICILYYGKKNYNFNWNLFVKPEFDRRYNLVSMPKKRPSPFAVLPRSSRDEEIEFFTDNFIIKKGKYNGEIQVWSEVHNIGKGPTETVTFNFSIDKNKYNQFKSELNSINTKKPVAMISVPIKEWSLGWEKNI